MLITRTNPAGIDWYVQQLQTKIHNMLISSAYWNLADATQYKAYGRCYRNKKDTGYVAENYESAKEYREVYWQDSLTAISFFGLSGAISVGAVNNEAEMHLVMFCDLAKLALRDTDGNLIVHRADAEVRQMLEKIIGKSSFGFQLVSTEFGIENVLKEYPGSIRDERLRVVDMHPVHCFRLNLKLTYNPQKNC